jgi:hypothetical protein
MGFITGRAGQGKAFAVIAQMEDDAGEEIDAWQLGFWRDGAWQADKVLYFKPAVITPVPAGPDAWFVLGEEGQCLWVDVAGQQVNVLREGQVGGGGVLPMFTDACAFGGGVAAIGMDRKVWFTADGHWAPLGTGLPERQRGETVGLQALAAHEGQLGACGWAGEMWMLSGQHWRRSEIPTNMILAGLAIAPEGQWFVCGRYGTFYRSTLDQWEDLNKGALPDDLWSVVHFKGRLFVSAIRSNFEFIDDQFKPVNDDMPDATYYHLSANQDVMVSVGHRSVLATFDGDDWVRVI